jgi:hypothetical protein
LVYGQEAILPNTLYLPYLQIFQASRGHPSYSLQQIIDTLPMLDEEREKDKVKFTTHQHVLKIWFDKHKAKDKNFEAGDLVLKWDKANESKRKHSKFKNIWLRPFLAIENIEGRHMLVEKSKGGI